MSPHITGLAHVCVRVRVRVRVRVGVGVDVGVHNVYCWAIQADETVKLAYVDYTRAVCALHGLCVARCVRVYVDITCVT